jgi:hypothetical protein
MMSEYATVPAGRNIVFDPRPNSLTYFSPASGTTVQLTTERSYSGLYSVRAEVADASNFQWLQGPVDNAEINGLVGDELYGRIHLSGPLSSGWVLSLNAAYDDGTFDSLSTFNIGALANNNFVAFDYGPLTLDPAKTLDRVYFLLGNNSGAVETVYVGGMDIRINTPMDGFIHGSGGDGYAWTGTANNSPSTRAARTIAPVLGHGGQYFPTMRVDVVNRQNQRIRDVTAYFRDGSINYDLDAERWKGTCTASFDRPGLIEPLGDEYLRFTLRVDYPDGSFEEGPVGMFIMDPPKEHWDGANDLWSYEGKDLLAILDSFMFRSIIGDLGTVGPGAFALAGDQKNILGAIRDLLLNYVGFSASQISFGGDLNKEGIGTFWEGGTSALRILTDLLTMAGWQAPWVTPAGIITSSKAAVDPATIGAAMTFSTGENSKVRWPFDVEIDPSLIGNRVRVVGAANVTSFLNTSVFYKWGLDPPEEIIPDNLRLEATVTNQDPSHPLSYQRLGRWIDIPDVDIPIWIGQDAANDAARQVLYAASHPPMTARLVTQAHLRGLNEVYELDLTDSYGEPIESGQGKYFCRGWTMQLGPPWEMVHTLKRTIPYEQSVFLP